MQPCAICGSVSINADGYCAQCGTFRGMAAPPSQSGYPPAQSGYPGHAQPTSNPGYPASGGYPAGGAPGYPQSPGAPGYPQSPGAPGYPTSGAAPGYPTSGGPQGFPTSSPPAGYPTAYPPVESRPKRSMLVPLIALAATLVVLVVGIGVVLAVRGDEPKPDVAGPSRSSTPTTPSASPKPAAADCLVGTWEVTSHEEEVDDEDFGKIKFRGGQGATMTYSSDGSGRLDYGRGTEYKTTVEGKPFILELKGVVTYRYKATAAKITFSDATSSATFRVVYDGEQVGQWDDYEAEEDERVSYTCSGDQMTQKTILYTTEFQRGG